MNEIKEYTEKLFDDIKHIDENENEYWFAREMQQVLDYKEWRKFENVINKGKLACDNSKVKIENHFVQTDKMINLGKGGKRSVDDYKLSRYACYLITLNSDPRKKSYSFSSNIFCYSNKKTRIK